MNEPVKSVYEKMIQLYSGDPKRIQHFTKVHAYATIIGAGENLSDSQMQILEIAALTHDIGIHYCETKYGECGGKLQEEEGPRIARKLLREADIEKSVIEQVCFLIAHHHTYSGVDSADWQILLEADFIVNAFEDDLGRCAVITGYKNIFKTESGKLLCRTIYGID